MAKRPLCVICSCFILLLLVLGQTQAAALLEERLPEKTVQALQTATSGRIYGQIYRIQPQEEGCTIYLKNTILLVRSNRYFLNNSKISYNQWPDVTIGDSVMASGKPSLAEAAGNPGQFDAAEYDAARHISVRMRARTLTVTKHKVSWIPETARRLRTCIRTEIERVLEPAEAGVLKTMLLGDKQDLETEVRQLYQKNGISHILAISGVKTLKLDIPLVPETRINWAFVPLHIAIIYILKLCLDEEIIPRCRFPCSRGYFTKCINWQKKQ